MVSKLQLYGFFCRDGLKCKPNQTPIQTQINPPPSCLLVTPCLHTIAVSVHKAISCVPVWWTYKSSNVHMLVTIIDRMNDKSTWNSSFQMFRTMPKCVCVFYKILYKIMYFLQVKTNFGSSCRWRD